MSDKQARMAALLAKLGAYWHVDAGVFASDVNVFLPAEGAFLEAWTFGRAAIFRGDASMLAWCRDAFAQTPAEDIMDGDGLYRLEAALRTHGYRFCGEHVRYLYMGGTGQPPLPVGITTRLFEGDAVSTLYEHKGFSNALNYRNDVIALAAYDGDTLVSIAAADDTLGALWQVGIDTIPAYRGRGLATCLVGALAETIEARGCQPFYTTWSANIASSRVALASGFLPTWMGYIAEKIEAE